MTSTTQTDRWHPSGRASDLIGVLLDAFEAGDRWVTFTSGHTARLTGQSLVDHGIAEFDPDTVTAAGWGHRIRLADEWVAANGWHGRNWQQCRIEMAADRRDDPDFPVNPYLDHSGEITFDASTWKRDGKYVGSGSSSRRGR